jgi:hypothetical protein
MKKLTIMLILLVAVSFAASPAISNDMLVETLIHHMPTGFVPLISGDGAGYYFWDSNESSDFAPTFSWIDCTGGTNTGMNSDDGYVDITTPAAWKFCGVDIAAGSDLFLGSNGIIGFSSYGMSSLGNQNIPDAGAPNDIIALHWDDLTCYTSDGAVVYAYTDTSGADDLYAVSYNDCRHYGGSPGELSFQTYFVENNTGADINNTVVIQHLEAGPETGSSATVGLENADGTEAANYCYNTGGGIEDNLAIIFIDAGYVDNYIDPLDLLAPADGAEVVDGTQVTFDWEDAAYAGSGNFYYEIALSENADLSTPFHEATGIASSTYDYTINQGNTSDVTVYWGVRAVEDTIGFIRNCSNIFSFTLHQSDYAVEETTWGQIKSM